MHMSDGLISVEVGCTMWAISAAFVYFSAKKLTTAQQSKLLPMMGVLGAFIFSAQMLNFTIPLTGSSGHLGGGLILACLLGPWAGFLVMACVLLVQAFFFADGGILALGCNLFNLGFFSCFVAYPLIYSPITQHQLSSGRICLASVLAAVAGLQLGSLGVVCQTTASGISDLPMTEFLCFMQPIHLAIGLVEGFATAAVLLYVKKAYSSLLWDAKNVSQSAKHSFSSLIGTFAVVALLCGTTISWFASSYPDGLEWSIASVLGHEATELSASTALHHQLATAQESTSIMPDYALSSSATATENNSLINPETSLAGVLGCVLVLLTVCIIGVGIGQFNKRARQS